MVATHSHAGRSQRRESRLPPRGARLVVCDEVDQPFVVGGELSAEEHRGPEERPGGGSGRGENRFVLPGRHEKKIKARKKRSGGGFGRLQAKKRREMAAAGARQRVTAVRCSSFVSRVCDAGPACGARWHSKISEVAAAAPPSTTTTCAAGRKTQNERHFLRAVDPFPWVGVVHHPDREDVEVRERPALADELGVLDRHRELLLDARREGACGGQPPAAGSDFHGCRINRSRYGGKAVGRGRAVVGALPEVPEVLSDAVHLSELAVGDVGGVPQVHRDAGAQRERDARVAWRGARVEKAAASAEAAKEEAEKSRAAGGAALNAERGGRRGAPRPGRRR